MPSRDADIDRLFQLPAQEFTKARNTLAAQAGSGGAAIRRLQKPPLAAWAVNQLFWKKRAVYESVVERAEALRREHKAVLTGRRGDIRGASRAHEDAIEAALKETLAIAAAEGYPITDATKQAIAKTLRALPSDEAPGRLTHALQPGGFEMLAGIAPAGRRLKPAPKESREVSKPEKGSGGRELARARNEAADAARALREAEQQARRDEFEKARAAREAKKARAQLEAARQALTAAERAVEAAERTHAAAEKARQKAEGRVRESAAAAEAARGRAGAARDPLKSPSSRGR